MPNLTQYSTLQSVKVTGNIYDSQAKIHVEQVYMSYNDRPLEITYQFALDPKAHIVAVSADIGDKTYQSQIMGRQKSKQEYKQGLADKFTVLRLTKASYGEDFVLALGNIEPKTRVVVKYTYITVVPTVADTFTYVFPTNIAPRYHPTKGSAANHWGGSSHLTYTTNTAYHFEFDIVVETSNGRLETVDSNLMRSATRLADNKYQLKGTVTPSDGTMVVTYKSEAKPCMYTNDGLYCYLRYDFPTEDAKDMRPKRYSILVDRSGSMDSDGKMADCISALEFTLDSLPPGSLFNIISFGNAYEFMWPEPRPYTVENRNIARAQVRGFKADMGGTELFQALEHVLTGKAATLRKDRPLGKWLSDRINMDSADAVSTARPDGPEHIIILMTDGQVSSAQQMAKMVNQTVNTRLCTLGIGRDANRNELVQLANGGRGFCYMASDSKDMTTLITNMIANCCMYKYFTNIRVNGKQVAEFGYPNMINTMYYKRVSPDEAMTLTYEDPEQPGVTVTRQVDITMVEGDNTITQLYYANMEPKNESALLEHSVLTKVNSFFLKSTEKIEATGSLAKETVAQYGGQVSEYLSLRDDWCGSMQLECTGLTQVAKSINMNKSLGTPCGCDLSEEEDGDVCGMFDHFEVRAASEPVKSSPLKRMASGASALFASAKSAFGISKPEPQTTPSPPKKSTMPGTGDILSFRNPTDGSFLYSVELLTLIGYTESEFREYLAANNLTQATGVNRLVLDYLVNTKDSKYTLVIAALRRYLLTC